MKKLTTEQAILYINRYYKSLGFKTEAKDWEVTKKYKNFNGFMCRDLLNKVAYKKAILIENIELNTINVIEEEDYLYFLSAEQKKTKYYFTPSITNGGLVFLLIPSSEEKNNEKWLIGNLKNKFEDNVLIIKKTDIFLELSFSNIDLIEIVNILESNNIKYKNSIIEEIGLSSEEYIPITPDDALVYYRFPEYMKFNNEKSIEEIFSIISKKDVFSDRDISIIKVLIQKINKSEFESIKNIALGFKKEIDSRIVDIFDKEEHRVKSKMLIDEIVTKR